MSSESLSADDLRRLAAVGIDRDEIDRQLGLLRSPPPPAPLVRPCRPGDGIVRLDPDRYAELQSRFDQAAAAGRAATFVPASGAASRMFRELLEAHSGNREAERKVDRELLPRLAELALYENLEAILHQRGQSQEDRRAVLDALLAEDGLAVATLPKGLVPFHRTDDGPRTAFSEHLSEAAEYLLDREGICRLHFTITESHRPGFERDLQAAVERMPGVEPRVGFSTQGHETDTAALGADGHPFRLDDGHLLLRPGGHGSLLVNLAASAGDLVFVKNIDNIQPARRRETVTRWKRLLGGYLLELEERLRRILTRLETPGAGPVLDEALALSRVLQAEPETLSRDPEEARSALLEQLYRPLRVCGVVRNEGEPGGGPFWVRRLGRLTPQIIESAEVDLDDPEQAAIWTSSTHFNPVDLVLGLRDPCGTPWDLLQFRDEQAVFVTRKSHQGRPLLALEHPGLWNGSMAGWNTVFVEVPAETFAPVKTIFDLLRDAHR